MWVALFFCDCLVVVVCWFFLFVSFSVVLCVFVGCEFVGCWFFFLVCGLVLFFFFFFRY